MATRIRLYTAEDLWQMPGDEPWELWEGELRKVPGAGGEATILAHWIGVLISNYVRPRKLGLVSGADGTYILARDPDTVVVPDVAFFFRERLPGGVVPKKFFPFPPEFAVEIVSPSDGPSDVARKMERYRRAGVPLVWWVYPETRTVTVYQNGQWVMEAREGDELNGGDVLPEFRLAVAEIFAEN
jgi:Uma2 family endonuclease